MLFNPQNTGMGGDTINTSHSQIREDSSKRSGNLPKFIALVCIKIHIQGPKAWFSNLMLYCTRFYWLCWKQRGWMRTEWPGLEKLWDLGIWAALCGLVRPMTHELEDEAFSYNCRMSTYWLAPKHYHLPVIQASCFKITGHFLLLHSLSPVSHKVQPPILLIFLFIIIVFEK